MEAFPVSKTLRPRPIDGWALSTLIELDEARPGTLRLALSGSALRRQAFFITLSLLRNGVEEVAGRLRPLCADQPQPSPLAAVASVLATCRVRDIVRALYGDVEGLVGALGRLGYDTLHPLAYQSLISLLSEPQHRACAMVLKQVEKITPTTISVLLALKHPFVFREVLDRLHSVRDAKQFDAAITLIRKVSPEMSEQQLANSIRALGPDTLMCDWVQRMVNKASRFPVAPPIHEDPDFVWLRSSEAMRDAAHRFSNCLKDRISSAALSRAVYIEFRPSPAIIVLACVNQNKFVLEGVHGPRNTRVSAEAARAIRLKLERAGVLLPARVSFGKRFNPVAEWVGLFQFDKDLDALEELDDSDLPAEIEQVEREFALA